MPADTVMEFHAVLAIHVVSVLVAFGAIFAHPLVFSLARSGDPSSLPLLHRIEYTVERRLVLPGLLVALISGVYLTGWTDRWSVFFVQWGILAILVIAAALGAVMMPLARRARALAERDARASAGARIELSEEYGAVARRLTAVSLLLGVLVLVTIFFMNTGFQA